MADDNVTRLNDAARERAVKAFAMNTTPRSVVADLFLQAHNSDMDDAIFRRNLISSLTKYFPSTDYAISVLVDSPIDPLEL